MIFFFRSIIDEVGKSKGNETMTRRKKNCFSAGRHWSYSRTITLSIKIRSALACLHGIVIEQCRKKTLLHLIPRHAAGRRM
ncbi:uncharacterized protein LOC143271803 isoform X2 [Peromyscus maniculatus bairdii]|uniref:uncharacterized protein LOC143271803 isoform X2 n=1 Tax=Peromyscus maniculatus bairdii TaxID=230844 RepID=UPI003FD00B07